MSISSWIPYELRQPHPLELVDRTMRLPPNRVYEELRALVDSGALPADVVQCICKHLNGTSLEHTTGFSQGMLTMAVLSRWIPTPPDLTPRPGFGRWVDGVGFVQPTEEDHHA